MATYQGAGPALVALAQITIGPVLIGTFLNVLLFGMSLTQFYLYWNMYRNDKLWMKLMIFLLLVLDVFNTVGLVVVVYHLFITQYGSQESVSITPWLIATTNCVISPLIAFMVQMFFAWRVRKLTDSYAIPICIVCLSVIANLSGIAVGVSIIGWVRSYVNAHRLRIPITLWLVSTVVCDCGNTSSLVWHLKVHKTGMEDTDTILDNIIWLTVQTGMITSIAAIVDLVLFLCFTAGYHLIFNMVLPGLYVITLLSSLNARARWKFGDGSASHDSRSLNTTIEFRNHQVADCEVEGPREILVMRPMSQVVSTAKVKTGQSDSSEHTQAELESF